MADLRFASDVDDTSVTALLDEVHTAIEAGETHLRVFLRTSGGDLNSAFAAYDHLRLVQHEHDVTIEMVGCGYCLSAGVVLLQAGTRRYVTPHTVLMLHQPEQYAWGENSSIVPDELHGRLELSRVTRSLLADIFGTRSGAGCEVWEALLAAMPLHFFNAADAKTKGLIDDILLIG